LIISKEACIRLKNIADKEHPNCFALPPEAHKRTDKPKLLPSLIK